MRRTTIIVVLVGIIAVLLWGSVITVPQGNIGVPDGMNFGDPDRVLKPGIHFVAPFVTKTQNYNTRSQFIKQDIKLSASRTIRLTSRIRLTPENVLKVHHQFGPNYIDEIVKEMLAAVIEKKVNESGAEVRSVEEQNVLRDFAKDTLEDDGIIVEKMILTILEEFPIITPPVSPDVPESTEESERDAETTL